MDPNRWRQIEDLYHLALEKPSQDRAAFLDRACSADPSLRQELESLLAIADGADAYVKAAVREASFSAGDATAVAPNALNPGSGPQKLGRYELLEQVGKGGMGVVYRAIDPAIGRTVAIKTMVINDGSDVGASELRTRLLRESQAGGQLSHPNIVAVYDVSEQGNVAYIVMEFIVGRSLDKALARDSYDATLRAPSRVMRIVQECASALDYAHSRGVIHRDIKPGNIMLQADGSVKIADFGIAKAAQFTALTQTAAVLGSPDYMAPEQWKGETVTGQADQYALRPRPCMKNRPMPPVSIAICRLRWTLYSVGPFLSSQPRGSRPAANSPPLSARRLNPPRSPRRFPLQLKNLPLRRPANSPGFPRSQPWPYWQQRSPASGSTSETAPSKSRSRIGHRSRTARLRINSMRISSAILMANSQARPMR
jgi:serine/threonine protein kinase